MGQRVCGIDVFFGDFRRVVPADQRLGQPVLMVNVIEPEPALDAEALLVGRSIAPGDVKQPVVLQVIGELAADAAIGADGIDRPVGLVLAFAFSAMTVFGSSAPVGQA